MDLDLVRRDEASFPSIEQPQSVKRARIWNCKYSTLRSVSMLKNLEVLVILGYPDSTFEPIAGLSVLRHLAVTHFPHVADLAHLGNLQRLETLSLSSLPSWDTSGKVLAVNSLEPITRLKGLKHLELFGVRAPDKSLASLLKLPGLQSARFSKYSKVEKAKFYEASGVSDAFAPTQDFGDA